MVRFLLAVILFLLSIPSAVAQLIGNYTIGGSTGASNFATWTDFALEFNKVGVSGKVQVSLQSNTSVNATVELKQHTTYPTTSTNTVVFTGNGYSVTGSISQELLLLNGVDYVEFKNINFINSSNNDSLIGVRFTNQADFNSINGCTIQFTGAFGFAKNASAYIAFANNNKKFFQYSANHLGASNTIKACTFTTTSANSPGPYFGIFHQGGIDSFKTAGTKNTFEGNYIQNFYSIAVYSRYSNGDRWLSNTINRSAASSSSPVDTNLVAIRFGRSYSGSQSTLINGNTITDLPYSGAKGNASIYLHRFYGMYLDSCEGTANTDINIESNTIARNVTFRYFEGIYVNRGTKISIKKNLFSKNRCYYGYYNYTFKIQGTTDLKIIGNRITLQKMGETWDIPNIGKWNYLFSYVIHCTNLYNKYWTQNVIEENIIDSNLWQRTASVIYILNQIKGGLLIGKNQILNNESPREGGSLEVIYLGTGNTDVHVVANLVANNYIDTFGKFQFINYVNSAFTSTNETNICNNTVHFQSNLKHRYGAVGIYDQENQKTKITGNIFYFDCPNTQYAWPVVIKHQSTSNPGQFEIDHNSYYLNAVAINWTIGSTTAGNFSNYKAISAVGAAENFVKIKFSDIPKNDFRQYSSLAQNNVPYRSINEKDLYLRVRNKKFHDRGAIETYFDIAADSTQLNIPKVVCSGWKKEVGLRIKNNNADTVYDFYVAYSVNGVVNREFVTHRIASKDTYTYYFKNPLIINPLDSVDVKIYIDAKDDTLSNDTIAFKTFVKESPGGSKFIPLDTLVNSNKPIYRSNGKPDVTVVNLPVLYSMPAPRTYTNAQFGTQWSASASAYTASGRKIPNTSIIKPSGTQDLRISFETKDTAIEDSVIQLAVTFTNYQNGCDTTLIREIYIAPLAWSNFKTKRTACTGDTLEFENTSTLKKGYFYSTWNFGTGVSADTSSDINSQFIFAKPGIYKVSLTTKTLEFGFKNSSELEVEILQTPIVNFTKQNGCAGAKVLFVNNSLPSKTKNYWSFGDGTGEVNNDSSRVVHTYSSAGFYTVKLRVDNKGCEAIAMNKVQLFESPIAAFDHVNGRCSKEVFEFTNKSILKSGSMGSRWYFNSYDSVSTSTHGKTRLNKGGKNWIQLIVKSDMGCADTLIKEILVYQTPVVDFDVDRACKYVVSQFLNKTFYDTVFNNSYHWDFGDGTKSALKQPTKKWNSLGGYTVKLWVESANLCKDSSSKNIQVLESVFPSFTANNACAGDPVSFKNSTTWESGKINFVWDFADNTFNTTSDPIKTFNPKITTSYFVTLKASITGGCADSFTQRVDIYETPRTCLVDASVDYSRYHWGIKATPKDKLGNVGGQDNVDYTFLIPGIDTVTVSNSGATAMLDVKSDGVYTVWMTAKMRNTGNCVCSGSTTVVVDRLNLNYPNSANAWKVQVSPNPTEGDMKISVFGANQVNSVRIKTMNGGIIHELESPAMVRLSNQVLEVPIQKCTISPGLYLLEVNTDLGTKNLRLLVK